MGGTVPAGIDSSCFQLKQESPLCVRQEATSKTSHAGIIRIGFEGISQPRLSEHPCFNYMIETLPAQFLQIRAQSVPGAFHPAETLTSPFLPSASQCDPRPAR